MPKTPKNYPDTVKERLPLFYTDPYRRVKLELLRYHLTALYLRCLRNKDKKATPKAVQDAIAKVSPPLRVPVPPGVVFRDLANLVAEFLGFWQDGDNLILTPDWLKGWFFVQVCRSERLLPAYLKPESRSPDFSPEETLEFLRHLASLGLYLLHWLKHGGEVDRFTFGDVLKGSKAVMAAVLYLIAEYAHLEGGLTRKAELFKTLEQIMSNEAVLYTIRDTYRDHINHMVETCLLGLALLEITLPTPLWRRSKPYFAAAFSGLTRQQVLSNWILAALLHDTGYALEICRLTSQPLRFITAPQVAGFTREFDRWFKDQEKAHLVKIHHCLGRALKWVYAADLPRFDHGVVSALFAMHLVRDKKAPEEEWRRGIRPALDAMARHNLKRFRTSYATNPLAFLLMLCDHLQEWDRPLVEGEEMRYSLVVNLLGKEWQGIGSDSVVDYLEVERLGFDGRGFTLNDRGGLTFNLCYKDARRNRYHPPPTWVSLTYDLQSLRDCPGEITIRMKHPSKPEKVGEMDLFQAFLRQDQEMSGLRDWAAYSRKGNRWFAYERQQVLAPAQDPAGPKETDPPKEYEVFTVYLHKIASTPVISELPDGYFGKYLAFWKERNPAA